MATLEKVPPLVDFKVNNPVTYIKLWWQKIMGKEGIDLSFRIHPVTTIVSVAIIATIGFGAGRITLPEGIKIPFFEFGFVPTSKPTATTINEWKETAFSGKLQFSDTTQKYFLITTSAEAITLNVPSNLALENLVGKRIMAVGIYNKQDKILNVVDAKDMEVLPKTPIAIPTVEPTMLPTVMPSSAPTDTGQTDESTVNLY